MMVKNNYAHFILSDCNLVSPTSYLLTDLGLINEITLKEQRARWGSVVVSQFGTTRIFSLICRDRFFDLTTEDDLYIIVSGLINAMYCTGAKSVRISKSNDGLEKLPENALRNMCNSESFLRKWSQSYSLPRNNWNTANWTEKGYCFRIPSQSCR